MARFKVNLPGEEGGFVETRSYQELYEKLQDVKRRKGRIIHVIGAPGTGKSTNIYHAIKSLNLSVYNAFIDLDHLHLSSRDVYRRFFTTLKEDMGVKSTEEVYKRTSQYDLVLVADKFHDTHLLYEDKVGFSQWMNKNGVKSLLFYLLLIGHYLRNRGKFSSINLVFQTSWAVKSGGKKCDLFTDFGVFSRLMLSFLKIFFEVVEISYSEEEIIEIVENKLPGAEVVDIKRCIDVYRSRIRFILNAMENLKED